MVPLSPGWRVPWGASRLSLASGSSQALQPSLALRIFRRGFSLPVFERLARQL
jgi:hypothetical protein